MLLKKSLSLAHQEGRTVFPHGQHAEVAATVDQGGQAPSRIGNRTRQHRPHGTVSGDVKDETEDAL